MSKVVMAARLSGSEGSAILQFREEDLDTDILSR